MGQGVAMVTSDDSYLNRVGREWAKLPWTLWA